MKNKDDQLRCVYMHATPQQRNAEWNRASSTCVHRHICDTERWSCASVWHTDCKWEYDDNGIGQPTGRWETLDATAARHWAHGQSAKHPQTIDRSLQQWLDCAHVWLLPPFSNSRCAACYQSGVVPHAQYRVGFDMAVAKNHRTSQLHLSDHLLR